MPVDILSVNGSLPAYSRISVHSHGAPEYYRDAPVDEALVVRHTVASHVGHPHGGSYEVKVGVAGIDCAGRVATVASALGISHVGDPRVSVFVGGLGHEVIVQCHRIRGRAGRTVRILLTYGTSGDVIRMGTCRGSLLCRISAVGGGVCRLSFRISVTERGTCHLSVFSLTSLVFILYLRFELMRYRSCGVFYLFGQLRFFADMHRYLTYFNILSRIGIFVNGSRRRKIKT